MTQMRLGANKNHIVYRPCISQITPLVNLTTSPIIPWTLAPPPPTCPKPRNRGVTAHLLCNSQAIATQARLPHASYQVLHQPLSTLMHFPSLCFRGCPNSLAGSKPCHPCQTKQLSHTQAPLSSEHQPKLPTVCAVVFTLESGNNMPLSASSLHGQRKDPQGSRFSDPKPMPAQPFLSAWHRIVRFPEAEPCFAKYKRAQTTQAFQRAACQLFGPDTIPKTVVCCSDLNCCLGAIAVLHLGPHISLTKGSRSFLQPPGPSICTELWPYIQAALRH